MTNSYYANWFHEIFLNLGFIIFSTVHCRIDQKMSSIQRKRITIEENIMGTILPSEILE